MMVVPLRITNTINRKNLKSKNNKIKLVTYYGNLVTNLVIVMLVTRNSPIFLVLLEILKD